MRKDATRLENGRLQNLDLQNYPWVHERHRIFPEVLLKEKKYGRILDVAAGVGVVAKEIHDNYDCFFLANDISEESIRCLKHNNIPSVSYDIDNADAFFPFSDGVFDAVIHLATLEHVIEVDHHMGEIVRVMKDGGDLYMSVPNYTGLHFVIPFLLTGKTFHDPMVGGISKYEFYAHVRYFTYRTLIEFISQFGFEPIKVYLPLPKASSRFTRLKRKSFARAIMFQWTMAALYKCLSPRWALHPVVLFRKSKGAKGNGHGKPKKVIL